ncbi:MAG: glycosyltransferase, partial [Anaerolineae bacterium]
HIVVPSESIRRILAELYGVHERVTVIPTGIDLRPYETAVGATIRQQKGWGDDRVLISIGRLAKEKNWHTLVAAAANVIRTLPDTRLIILGDGEERENLQKQARELGVADRIELPGIVPFDEVPHYLKAADLFCFASVTETQGLVTLEAMAGECPVVAVGASGTSDVIAHEVEGLLTRNDASALAEAMVRVLQDDDLRHSLSAAALAKAKLYDSKRQAVGLTAVYEQAIADKAANRFVQVDNQKPLLKGKWFELLGFEKNPFRRLSAGQ